LNKARIELCRRLEYKFADTALLERALTHRSKSGNNYERLEFLGDSVLNFTISAELYDRFPNLSEGELTRLRASLVKKDTLARIARTLNLGDCLALGEGELKSGGYDRDSILADSLEAVFGAIFIDNGMAATRSVIRRIYKESLAKLDSDSIPKDPKTQLQELLQKRSLATPIYNVLEVSGAPHQQVFVVECQVAGLSEPVCGKGGTRRHAEQQAAALALKQLRLGKARATKR
jgi:ribonuclease III